MDSSYGSAAARGFRRRSPSLDSDSELESQFQDLFQDHFESKKDLGDGMDVEPLFYDREEELERIKRMVEEKKGKDERQAEEKKREAEEKKRREEELERSRKKHDSIISSIREFDPKSKTMRWTRYPFEHFGGFDIDEESAIPPMRHTGIKYEEGCRMYWSANIFSIKVVSSDAGFPINVYGTVIARDSLDHKCIYLFRCHRRDSQIIKSEDKSLVLIGPSRGFFLADFIFLEVDLKIRRDQGKDEQLSKGLFEIDGRVVTRQDIEVKSVSHASWFSTLEVHYAAVKRAMEATVEFRVLQGEFYGKIKAHTYSIPNKMLLYHSKRGGVVTSDGGGTIHLWRPVIAVCLDDMLVFTIVTQTSNDGIAETQAGNDGTAETPILKTTRVIRFTPMLYDADKDEFLCGAVKFHVKVTWSLIDRFY